MKRHASLLAALAVLVIPLAAGGYELPAGPGAARVDAFAARHVDEDLLVLQKWDVLDVKFRSKDGGLSGDYVSVLEYRVQSRAALEGASMVWVFDEPARRIENVYVTVEQGGRRTSFASKDLDWIEVTQNSRGVVTLDGTEARAVLPGLRVGDTVRVVRRWKLHGIHGLSGWTLGAVDRPTLEAGLILRVPDDYVIEHGILGAAFEREALGYYTSIEDEQQVHRWKIEADEAGVLPACRDRYASVRVTPFVAHAGRYHRESMAVGADWSEVGEAYLERVADAFEPSRDMEASVAATVAGASGTLDVIDRIYARVQRDCRYLGLFEGMGGVLPEDAERVFEVGFGDCKGLGALLIAMLRAAGVEAHPVLLRTRSSGPLDASAPNMAQFDHFIVWADDGGEGVFLDATVDHCPAGRVPEADTLSPVLLLRPGSVRLVEIPESSWTGGVVRMSLDGRLDEAGALTLDLEHAYDGDVARWIRDVLAGEGRRNQENFVSEVVLPSHPPFIVESAAISGQEQWREPVLLSATASSRGALPADGANVLLPMRLADRFVEFSPTLRCDEPVDLRLYPSHRESWSIELPDGWALASADTLEADLGVVRWRRALWQEGAVLRMERRVDWSPALVSPDEAEEIETALDDVRSRESGYVSVVRD